MDPNQLARIGSGQFLDVIRERPPMYLGTRSLTALYHFITGYGFALHARGIEELIFCRWTFMIGWPMGCIFTNPPAVTQR
jgi:hypothetical protein